MAYRANSLKNLTVLLMLTASACRAGDIAEGNPSSDEEARTTITVQTKNNKFKPIIVNRCSAGAVLESRSPIYARLKATKEAAEDHTQKFSKGIDVQSQNVTKFTGREGARLYETDPIIVFEPYEGSLRQVRSKQKNGIKENKWPGFAKYGYQYYWEKGAFKKNPKTGWYFVEPSKFKVYLSFEITVPEWWHIKSGASSKDREYWNNYICSLYSHEREHMEITREHMLAGIEDTLALKAKNSNQLEVLVRREWKFLGSELRMEQKAFDTRTDHGRKSNERR